MDPSRQTIDDADISKLNEKDKGELRQFLSMESKRAEVQASASSPVSRLAATHVPFWPYISLILGRRS